MSNLDVQRIHDTGLDDLTLQASKPTPNQLVIDLLVDSSLGEARPVSALISLQRDRRFRYAGGQRMILASLAQAERAAFQDLESTKTFSERLSNCAAHHGELFKDLIDSGGSSRKSSKTLDSLKKLGASALTDHLCMTWAHLMTDELTYLADQETLSPDQISLGLHACAILQSLVDWWSRPDAPELPQRAGLAVIQTLEQLLGSPAIVDLVETDRSLDGAALLEQLIYLSGSLGDPVILEEVADLLPSTFAVCQELCPELFSRPEEDDLSDDSENPYDSSVDSFASSAEKIDADSPEAKFIESDLAQADLENALIDAWERVFKLNLLAFESMPERAHRADTLIDILRSCPSDSEVWCLLLDALITTSHQSLKELLPELLSRAQDDPLGGAIVLQIADFSSRTGNDEATDPCAALVAALRQLPREERNALLKQCKELLSEEPELFADPAVTKQALQRLHAELKKPLK